MWDELGIAPCDDPKAIRRAYAARLKKLDPDADPESFARLRQAFEWALAHGAEAIAPEPASESAASARADAAQHTEPDDDTRGDSSAGPSDDVAASVARRTSPAEAAAPNRAPRESDDDEVRDRATLIALDAALRRREVNAAIALYYRAAATGALSFATAPDALERVLALAVDDQTLDADAFRRLARTAGLDAPTSRTRIASELQQRVHARLAAERWYDRVTAAAGERKGRVARRRAKIARYLLGRIGRHWHPRMDRDALNVSLIECRRHLAWLEGHIDPAWIDEIDARRRRRQIFWLSLSILFIAAILIDFAVVSIASVIEGEAAYAELASGLALVAVFCWVLKFMIRDLITLAFRRGRP